MFRNVLARFGEDIVDTHIPPGILGRMIMDMNMPDVWDGFIDQQLNACGDAIPLPDGQRAIDPDRQIDHEMRPEAVRLDFLKLLHSLDIFQCVGAVHSGSA